MLQVLCSNSVLDSSEYWLRNEKALCRLGLLDDDTEGGCTMVSSIRTVLATKSDHVGSSVQSLLCSAMGRKRFEI